MDANDVKHLRDVFDELLYIIRVECGYSVHCPCCGESETCLPECDYAEDFPADAEKMARLRRVVGEFEPGRKNCGGWTNCGGAGR